VFVKQETDGGSWSYEIGEEEARAMTPAQLEAEALKCRRALFELAGKSDPAEETMMRKA